MNALPLFRLETNNGVEAVPLDPLGEATTVARLARVAAAFGLPRPGETSRFVKRDPLSALYLADFDGQTLVLRRSADVPVLELQARLAATCGFPGIVQPLRTADGHCTLAEGGDRWLVYPYVPGTTYAGDVTVQRVLADWLRLNAAIAPLRSSLSFGDLVLLNLGELAGWSRLLDGIIAGSGGWAEVLSPVVRSAIARHRHWLEPLAERALRFERLGRWELIYDDLHPANLVVDGRGGVHFLDVASIFLANREAAACYGLFKLLRECLYRGTLSVESALEELAACVRLISAAGLDVRSVEEAFWYTAAYCFRNLQVMQRLLQEPRPRARAAECKKLLCYLFELAVLFPDCAGTGGTAPGSGCVSLEVNVSDGRLAGRNT